MIEQSIFILCLLLSLAVFSYSVARLFRLFRLTKPAYRIENIPKRIALTIKVAFGQTKIFRNRLIGSIHALVFWGFLIITLGSIEMVIDGVVGKSRVFQVFGSFYDVVTALNEIFALIIIVAVLVFLFRRIVLKIKRFESSDIKQKSHNDAIIALTLILLLMVTLLLTNIAELAHNQNHGGLFPVSYLFASVLPAGGHINWLIIQKISTWSHVLLIYLFANYLPYSKHFHVFLSIPNVFLSRLEPKGKLDKMESVANEVKIMLNPESEQELADDNPETERFGVSDIEDVSWKNYLDSLSCTQCGRCTSVCPANLTGKKLSPRKIFIDLRERMNEKGLALLKEGKTFSDDKTLIKNYISEEEIWACTTCNACATECPININHPSLIVDMRRFLTMEEGQTPAQLNLMFSNIENNGAPWQFSQDDRMDWTN